MKIIVPIPSELVRSFNMYQINHPHIRWSTIFTLDVENMFTVKSCIPNWKLQSFQVSEGVTFLLFRAWRTWQWRRASRWPWSVRSAVTLLLSSCGSERTTRLRAPSTSRSPTRTDSPGWWFVRRLLKTAAASPAPPPVRREPSAPPATCSSKVIVVG